MVKDRKSASKKKRTTKQRGSNDKSVAVRGSSVPANWQSKLAERAAAQSDRVPASTGNTITLKKNGQFFFQGTTLGDTLQVVILDHVFLKKWFEDAYDESNPGPPSCFALKATMDNISPHDDSPSKQSETCEDCWANEFGSHPDRERSKACADRHRIALLHGDAITEESDIIVMEVPVTSRGAFNKYIKNVTSVMNVPVDAVLTEIKMDPDADWQKLEFELLEPLPDKLGVITEARLDEARKLLLTPYDTTGYKKTKKSSGSKERGKGRGKTSSKKGGKKRGRRSRFS